MASDDKKTPVGCLDEDGPSVNRDFGGEAETSSGEVPLLEVDGETEEIGIGRCFVCGLEIARDKRVAKESFSSRISLSQSDFPVEITTSVNSVCKHGPHL